MKWFKTTVLMVMIALSLSVSSVGAYVYCGFHDSGMNMTAIHWNSEFWVDMLVNEANKWNTVHPELTIGRTRQNTVPVGRDGRNIISWISEADLNRSYSLSWSGVVAWTISWTDGDCGRMVEADMMFNPGLSLFTPQTQVPYNLGYQETALHELGHVLTQDHEDRTLAVMTSGQAVSDVLYTSDKVGWLRSAASRFSTTDRHDIGVFPLSNAGTNKNYSQLSPSTVSAGNNVSINNFTVQNLSSGFAESNVVFRVVLENVSSGASRDIGTFSWGSFCAYCSWSGNLTYRVPSGTTAGNYRVVAINQNGDSDASNDRAVFGTIRVN